MAFLDLDKLENLQELKRLPEGMQRLDQLQHLDQMQNLQKLDKLEDLQHMDQLQNLDKLQDLQHMDNLQNLDKLQDLQHMDHLQQLNQLSQLQQMQHLQEIRHLDRLGALSKMNELGQLGQLRQLQDMQSLNNLKSLDQLQVLDRLKIFDRLFEVNTLLYLLGLFVPGLIFQEVISLLLGGVSLRRGLVLMTVYNVLNLFVCMILVYNHLYKLEPKPFYYYGSWLAMLVVIPALLGWLMAWLTPYLNRFFSKKINIPTKIMATKWGGLLSGAASYQIIVTMNNEEKIRGIVSKEIPSPTAVDPGGLFLTETSHYSPDVKNWQDLEQPRGVWVKGTEIKMMEVEPETG